MTGAPAGFPRLVIDGLGFDHPGLPLFDRLSIRCGPGLLQVRGGDGRGKTTLLRLLAGELSPARGRILLERSDALTLCPGEDGWRQQAMLAGADQRADDATVLADWLRAALAPWPNADPQRCDSLVPALGLTPHLGKTLAMLSTGTRRKAGLLAGFCCGAPLTLIDDPFAALDRQSIAVVESLTGQAARWTDRLLVVAHFEAVLPARVSPVLSLGD